MDVEDYKSLVSKAKLELSKAISNQDKGDKDTQFLSSLMEDCRACIHQSIISVPTLLEGQNISRIIENLNNSVYILQELHTLLKETLQPSNVTCRGMKKLPLTTGYIILTVFTHCKESETIYKSQLTKFAKQLKDLFKSCHDLQTAYLMILEKVISFDCADSDDLQTLVEGLSLNMKIGEVVVSLDLKTMAEQWKVFSALCDKYSTNLLDQDIYNYSTECLTDLIIDNIKISMEDNQEQKLLLRALKVTSFLIKIHMKLYQVLKICSKKNYQPTIFLLSFIKMHSHSYLTKHNKSAQFINLFDTNVVAPADNYITELITDHLLYKSLYEYDISILNIEEVFGNLFLMVDVMKRIVKREDGQDLVAQEQLEYMIIKIFEAFPVCYKYITNFNEHSSSTYGVYEEILLQAASIATMFNECQYVELEKLMFEAIMSTDCFLALFASDLWVLLARICSSNLRHDHLIFLCETYISLEKNKLFLESPQQVQLANLMERIFVTMAKEERIRFVNENPFVQELNYSIWSALKVRNVPINHYWPQVNILLDKCKILLNRLFTAPNFNEADICNLTSILKVAATCPLNKIDISLKTDIVRAWLKLCKLNIIGDGEGTLWFKQFVEALCDITEGLIKTNNCNPEDLVKILHVLRDLETTPPIGLYVLNILATLSVENNKENFNIENAVSELLQQYMELKDNTMLFKVYNIIRKHQYSISSNVRNSAILKDFIDKDEGSSEEEYVKIEKLRFTHKCYVDQLNIESIHLNQRSKSCNSNNFELADIDSLFSNESDVEGPACKKAKLDNSETEYILRSLESSASTLCNLSKESITKEHKVRLDTICDKLKLLIK